MEVLKWFRDRFHTENKRSRRRHSSMGASGIGVSETAQPVQNEVHVNSLYNTTSSNHPELMPSLNSVTSSKRHSTKSAVKIKRSQSKKERRKSDGEKSSSLSVSRLDRLECVRYISSAADYRFEQGLSAQSDGVQSSIDPDYEEISDICQSQSNLESNKSTECNQLNSSSILKVRKISRGRRALAALTSVMSATSRWSLAREHQKPSNHSNDWFTSQPNLSRKHQVDKMAPSDVRMRNENKFDEINIRKSGEKYNQEKFLSANDMRRKFHQHLMNEEMQRDLRIRPVNRFDQDSQYSDSTDDSLVINKINKIKNRNISSSSVKRKTIISGRSLDSGISVNRSCSQDGYLETDVKLGHYDREMRLKLSHFNLNSKRKVEGRYSMEASEFFAQPKPEPFGCEVQDITTSDCYLDPVDAHMVSFMPPSPSKSMMRILEDGEGRQACLCSPSTGRIVYKEELKEEFQYFNEDDGYEDFYQGFSSDDDTDDDVMSLSIMKATIHVLQRQVEKLKRKRSSNRRKSCPVSRML